MTEPGTPLEELYRSLAVAARRLDAHCAALESLRAKAGKPSPFPSGQREELDVLAEEMAVLADKHSLRGI